MGAGQRARQRRRPAGSRAPATSTRAAGYAYKLLRDRPLDELPAEPYPVFAAPGAAPVFRRDVFDALGGYEERFFLYYEDVDLAFRAVLAG